MNTERRKVERITQEVRACFNRLKALGDELHSDLGISASMRAVMEALHVGEEQTVPQIARGKAVSRQHIQILTNKLAENGLVKIRSNPNDKRSPLVSLSEKGKITFSVMHQREKEAFDDLITGLAGCNFDAALEVLEAMHMHLDHKLESKRSST
ncbi:MAG: MarR family transcriptional regulator [Magnetococcales bacterium]|nr:MarR family transcriptional regulator [Magnetococcales bacterium]